jgi:hypothetical protein
LVIRYQAAKSAVCDFLSDDTRSRRTLDNARIEQLDLAKLALSDFAKNDAALCAEAIEAFQALASDNATLKALTFVRSTSRLPSLNVSGVTVSINLDLVVRKQFKGLVGGAILQTSKGVASKNWREEHSKSVASLVWMLAERHLAALGAVDRKLCLAVDIFGGNVTPAPNNYRRRLNDIEAACVEIKTLWPHITPPAGFDGEP